MTDERKITLLREALRMARDEINWWADNHRCCDGGRAEVIAKIDACLESVSL
jgi:hypothetical protein